MAVANEHPSFQWQDQAVFVSDRTGATSADDLYRSFPSSASNANSYRSFLSGTDPAKEWNGLKTRAACFGRKTRRARGTPRMKASKQHFELVERVNRKLRASDWNDAQAIGDVLLLFFAEEFQKHNKAGFDRERFLKSCGSSGKGLLPDGRSELHPNSSPGEANSGRRVTRHTEPPDSAVSN